MNVPRLSSLRQNGSWQSRTGGSARSQAAGDNPIFAAAKECDATLRVAIQNAERRATLCLRRENRDSPRERLRLTPPLQESKWLISAPPQVTFLRVSFLSNCARGNLFMAEDKGRYRSTPRREFLVRVSAAAAGSLGVGSATAAQSTTVPMASIQLGPHRVSRLIVGWNPIDGHSHSTLDMALAMREWFTVNRTMALLEDCLSNGITTWQYDHTPKSVQTLRRLWEKGLDLKTICLHAERKGHDAPIKTVIDETKPIGMVHHGGVTETKFRAGKSQEVRDYVKKVKDQGILAGVSTHCPDTIKRIVDEGWENDFFMCSFYYLTRQREEMQKQLGKVPVGEPFFESDPKEMTAVIRQVSKPCLAFKLLAAGRLAWNKRSVENAFAYAFANIKPTDAVIVGMFPRYSDQVRENAAYRASTALCAREGPFTGPWKGGSPHGS